MDTLRTQNQGDYRGIPSCMDKENSSRESIVTPIEKTNLNTYHTIVWYGVKKKYVPIDL